MCFGEKRVETTEPILGGAWIRPPYKHSVWYKQYTSGVGVAPACSSCHSDTARPQSSQQTSKIVLLQPLQQPPPGPIWKAAAPLDWARLGTLAVS